MALVWWIHSLLCKQNRIFCGNYFCNLPASKFFDSMLSKTNLSKCINFLDKWCIVHECINILYGWIEAISVSMITTILIISREISVWAKRYRFVNSYCHRYRRPYYILWLCSRLVHYRLDLIFHWTNTKAAMTSGLSYVLTLDSGVTSHVILASSQCKAWADFLYWHNNYQFVSKASYYQIRFLFVVDFNSQNVTYKKPSV